MEGGQPPRVRGIVCRGFTGTWGAQICVDRRVLWLGTYATLADAGIAYDRASLKLHRYSSLNFPMTISPQELRFQSMFSFETIVSMIRLKTYSREYAAFLAYDAALAAVPCLASGTSSQQSAGDTESGVVSEAPAPIMLFGVQIGYRT